MNSTQEPSPTTESLIGNSPAFQAIFDLIDRIADTPVTVLITGESGTGKELVARELHTRSKRQDQPFVPVNCTAIPANLLEAELFGYEKGAFTDAKISKMGLFELADEGTLFLDEIGLMPPDLQAKILSVLETRTFRHVGGIRDIHADVRIVAATNEDLATAVREGRFRQDLYYRLNVVPIPLPPLRNRQDDAVLIAHHFLSIYGPRYRRNELTLSKSAERWLRNYEWPGNVRELRNVMERAVLLCRGATIDLEDLAIGSEESDFRTENHPPALEIDQLGDIRITLPPWGIALDDVDRRLIQEALKRAKGNITAAAQLLHTSRDTLRYRIKKYNLDAEI